MFLSCFRPAPHPPTPTDAPVRISSYSSSVMAKIAQLGGSKSPEGPLSIASTASNATARTTPAHALSPEARTQLQPPQPPQPPQPAANNWGSDAAPQRDMFQRPSLNPSEFVSPLFSRTSTSGKALSGPASPAHGRPLFSRTSTSGKALPGPASPAHSARPMAPAQRRCSTVTGHTAGTAEPAAGSPKLLGPSPSSPQFGDAFAFSRRSCPNWELVPGGGSPRQPPPIGPHWAGAPPPPAAATRHAPAGERRQPRASSSGIQLDALTLETPFCKATLS